MKVVTLKPPAGINNLIVSESGQPKPGPGEVLVRVHASSINYHDYAVAAGWLKLPHDRIPMSDGAGVVTAVGEGVNSLKAGDHVVSLFYPNWITGNPMPESLKIMPGDRTDGFAREFVAMPESAFTKAPPDYSHVEAATLTCAGLTAWNGLVVKGRVKSGDVVLIQGTGGVSLFALQLAKAAGATVVATSSSDQKLERLKALGAEVLVNYKQFPEWGAKVKELTGGVDHVIEIGGAGTLNQSIIACRMNGQIALIGILAGMSGEISAPAVFGAQITISGVNVGSRTDQEDMVRAVTASKIKPVIDSIYPLDDIQAAFSHFESRAHFGKVCLKY